MLRTSTFTMILLALLLTACSGGGGGSTPSAVPTGKVTGTVLDGLILNGTVTAYDYSTGTKGSVLGQATTDTRTGTYALSLQVESRPLLLEITGGYYNEEMAPTTNIPLDTGDKMQAVVNYTTGASITTSITAYTTAAAGLAAYEIKKGTAVATAISDANMRFSNLVGFDIIKTVPLEITDVANASASLTSPLKYGFLAGGISMWAYNNHPTGVAPLQKPYISIKFVQLMYQDVAADGLLNGMGTDNTSNPVQLSFGTVPLSPTVYRQGVGVSMLQMAQHANNKTGLGSSMVLPFAETYAGSTDPMWAGVQLVPISSPIVTITSPTPNAWMRGTPNVTASIQDYVGLSSAELIVNSASVSTVTTNLTTPVFPLNTTSYSDGAHTIAVKATNTVGLSTTATVGVQVDNTPPTLALPTTYLSAVNYCAVNGNVFDSRSGPAGVITATWGNSYCSSTATSTITNNSYGVVLQAPYSVPGGCANTIGMNNLAVTATDTAGNTRTTNFTLSHIGSCLGPRPSGPCSCSIQ